MAEPRAGKLRRLENFRRRLPHISASALESVLNEVERSGVPDAHSRRDMREARNLEVEAPTPYGPLFHTSQLPAAGGGTSPPPHGSPICLYVEGICNVLQLCAIDEHVLGTDAVHTRDALVASVLQRRGHTR